MEKSGYMAMLYRLAPFLQWLPELKKASILRADIIAGITVALVLIPQSMAYAQLAGLPPYYGLYAAFLPPAVAALFGSSRQLATGPVAIVSLLTAAALEPIATAGGASYIAYAIMLALAVGLFQMALGLLRLGVLVNFLSHPVVLGFTNAAAIIIATSQLGKIFGVTVEKAAHHYETVYRTVLAAMDYTHLPTLGMAVLAFVIMIVLKRTSPKIPNVLVAVAITTLLSFYIGFEKREIIELDQLGSKTFQEMITSELNMTNEIPALEQNVTNAKLRYENLGIEFGQNDVRVIAAQQFLDNHKLKLEQRLKASTEVRKEFKHLRFQHNEQSNTFYLEGQAPKDVVVSPVIWKMTTFDNEGRLTMEAGGSVVGKVPTGLPAMKVPTFDWAILSQLFVSAIAIALIGFMEAVSIAKAMATRTRQRLDVNRELVGQGISNIVGSMFQSYAVSGSFSRSAVNIGAGAITGFSSVVTTIVVVITLLWLTPLLYHLPQATLAAVIMMAVIGLVNFRHIKHFWTVNRADGAVSILTFFLTLAFAPHLENAIMIGVIVSLAIFLYHTMKPRVVTLSRHPDGSLRDAELFNLAICENISMIRFDGSLYFANTSYFEDSIMEKVVNKPDLKFVIVDGSGINDLDATGEEMLVQMTEQLQQSGIEVLFTQFKKQVMDILWQSGFTKRASTEKRFFRRVESALDYAWEALDDEHEVDCPLNIVCQLEKSDEKTKTPITGIRRWLRF